MKSFHIFTIILFLLIMYSISEKPKNKETFTGYFYIKQLYSGPDPISSLLISRQKMQLKFFTLTKRMLYYSQTDKDRNQVEDSIKIEAIINKKVDNLNTGKCCININKKTYSSNLNIDISNHTTKMNIMEANYCVEVKAEDSAFWRICSDRENAITKLQLKLIYNILNTNKNKNKNFLSNII